MAKEKKKLRDTKVGLWLKNKAPDVLNVVGGFLPNAGALGIVKNLISKKTDLPESDRLEFEKMQLDFELEMAKIEVEAEKEITKRWEADDSSKYWLPQNIRPLALAYVLILVTILIVGDSAKWFSVKEVWIPLIVTLVSTVTGGYFILRETGKFIDRKYKKG